jgi:hypothetical protein
MFLPKVDIHKLHHILGHGLHVLYCRPQLWTAANSYLFLKDITRILPSLPPPTTILSCPTTHSVDHGA